ncbi:hypothetical protein M0R19_03660 [Candidatus Pacearchaeota archaeon]|jgi:hypothetical protein|nr:hypothetical protein [Candidatus Pacearchaeota archaeon]
MKLSTIIELEYKLLLAKRKYKEDIMEFIPGFNDEHGPHFIEEYEYYLDRKPIYEAEDNLFNARIEFEREKEEKEEEEKRSGYKYL